MTKPDELWSNLKVVLDRLQALPKKDATPAEIAAYADAKVLPELGLVSKFVHRYYYVRLMNGADGLTDPEAEYIVGQLERWSEVLKARASSETVSKCARDGALLTGMDKMSSCPKCGAAFHRSCLERGCTSCDPRSKEVPPARKPLDSRLYLKLSAAGSLIAFLLPWGQAADGSLVMSWHTLTWFGFAIPLASILALVTGKRSVLVPAAALGLLGLVGATLRSSRFPSHELVFGATLVEPLGLARVASLGGLMLAACLVGEQHWSRRSNRGSMSIISWCWKAAACAIIATAHYPLIRSAAPFLEQNAILVGAVLLVMCAATLAILRVLFLEHWPSGTETLNHRALLHFGLPLISALWVLAMALQFELSLKNAWGNVVGAAASWQVAIFVCNLLFFGLPQAGDAGSVRNGEDSAKTSLRLVVPAVVVMLGMVVAAVIYIHGLCASQARRSASVRSLGNLPPEVDAQQARVLVRIDRITEESAGTFVLEASVSIPNGTTKALTVRKIAFAVNGHGKVTSRRERESATHGLPVTDLLAQRWGPLRELAIYPTRDRGYLVSHLRRKGPQTTLSKLGPSMKEDWSVLLSTEKHFQIEAIQEIGEAFRVTCAQLVTQNSQYLMQTHIISVGRHGDILARESLPPSPRKRTPEVASGSLALQIEGIEPRLSGPPRWSGSAVTFDAYESSRGELLLAVVSQSDQGLVLNVFRYNRSRRMIMADTTPPITL